MVTDTCYEDMPGGREEVTSATEPGIILARVMSRLVYEMQLLQTSHISGTHGRWPLTEAV